jgi:hypothetical protein
VILKHVDKEDQGIERLVAGIMAQVLKLQKGDEKSA